MQSQVNLSNLRQHMLEYTMLAFCGLLYNSEPERMLMLGLGGGACQEAPTTGGHNDNDGGGAAVCGNEVVELGEECDDGVANSDSDPDACRTDCRQAYCGDGVIDGGEICDDERLAGASCVTLGYSKGTLACAPDCTPDLTDCTRCGDGVAEGADSGAFDDRNDPLQF